MPPTPSSAMGGELDLPADIAIPAFYEVAVPDYMMVLVWTSGALMDPFMKSTELTIRSSTGSKVLLPDLFLVLLDILGRRLSFPHIP